MNSECTLSWINIVTNLTTMHGTDNVAINYTNLPAISQSKQRCYEWITAAVQLKTARMLQSQVRISPTVCFLSFS